MTQELPEGWAVAPLSKIAQLGFGQSPPSFTYNEEGRGLPFFQGKAEFGARHPTARKWCKSPTRTAAKGDILLSIRAPVGPTNVAPSACGIGRGLVSIRPANEIPTQYVLYFLRLKEPDLAQQGTGTTFGAITKPVVERIEVPIAPSRAQHEIASKLDEIFSRIDDGDRSLERSRVLLERYRQSVLKAAVTGELTREWRELHKRELGAAKEALGTGAVIRRVPSQHSDVRTKVRGDQWPVPVGSKTERGVPHRPADAVPAALPAGWTWIRLGDLAAPVDRAIQSGPFGSALLHSEFRADGRLVIGIDNVCEGLFSLGSNHRISESKFQQLSRFRARPSDFLITVMATIGRTCVVPEDIEPAIITKHVYRVTPNRELVISRYLNLCVMGSPTVRSQVFGRAQGGTRPGLNKAIIESILFPIPSIVEQRFILDATDAHLNRLRLLSSIVGEQRKKLSYFRQSLLHAAFTGHLVRQDPNDEPASVLLERIAAERAAEAPTKKAARSRKNTKK